MSNLINAIEGGMAYEGLKERYDKLAAKKKELSHELEEEKLDNPTLSKDQIQYALLRFQAADIESLEDRKALIWAFINSVYLYDDKGGYTLINFNYKKHSKVTTPNEIINGVKKINLVGTSYPNSIYLIGDCVGVKVSLSTKKENLIPFYHKKDR